MFERRIINSKISLRDGAQSLTEFSSANPPTIVGYAAKWNVLSSDLGGWREKIFPGTFTRSLREGKNDCKMLRDHDSSRILGRQKNKTLTLTEDARGLHFSCLLPNTSEGRDAYELVRTGTVSECSFAFSVNPNGGESWAEETVDGERINVRTLMDADLFDVSMVSQPAYPDTVVSVAGLSPIAMGRSIPESAPIEFRSRIIEARNHLTTTRERNRAFVEKMLSL